MVAVVNAFFFSKPPLSYLLEFLFQVLIAAAVCTKAGKSKYSKPFETEIIYYPYWSKTCK
jgi:hypothetical protein